MLVNDMTFERGQLQIHSKRNYLFLKIFFGAFLSVHMTCEHF